MEEVTSRSSFHQLSHQLLGEYNGDNNSVPRGPFVELVIQKTTGDGIGSKSLLSCKTKRSTKKEKLKASQSSSRCLICYVELFEGQNYMQQQTDAEYTQTLSTFLDIIVEKKKIRLEASGGNSEIWSWTSSIPSPCTNCYGALKRLVFTWQELKKFEESLFELKSKIISAVKLSSRMAVENEIKGKGTLDLDTIRTFLIEGSKPPLEKCSQKQDDDVVSRSALHFRRLYSLYPPQLTKRQIIELHRTRTRGYKLPTPGENEPNANKYLNVGECEENYDKPDVAFSKSEATVRKESHSHATNSIESNPVPMQSKPNENKDPTERPVLDERKVLRKPMASLSESASYIRRLRALYPSHLTKRQVVELHKANQLNRTHTQTDNTVINTEKVDKECSVLETQSFEQTEDVHRLRPGETIKFETEYFSDTVSNDGENYDDLDPDFIPDITDMSAADEPSNTTNPIKEALNNAIVETSPIMIDPKPEENNESKEHPVSNKNRRYKKPLESLSRYSKYIRKIRALYPPHLTNRQVQVLHKANRLSRPTKIKSTVTKAEKVESQSEDVLHLRPRKKMKFNTEYFSDTASKDGENFDELDPDFIPDITDINAEDEDNVPQDKPSSVPNTTNETLINESVEVIPHLILVKSDDNKDPKERPVLKKRRPTKPNKGAVQTSGDGGDVDLVSPSKPKYKSRKGRDTWLKVRALYPTELSSRQVRKIHSALLPARKAVLEESRALHLRRRNELRAKKNLAAIPNTTNNPEETASSRSLSWVPHWHKLKKKYPGKSAKEILDLEKEERIKEILANDLPPVKSGIGLKKERSIRYIKQLSDNKFLYRDLEVCKLEDGTFECPVCKPSVSYGHRNSIIAHINKKHIDLSNSHECEHCGKKYYYHYQLQSHLQDRHHIGERYMCHLCGMSFATRSGRHYHILGVHEKKKPFTCEHCGKAFLMRKDFTIHVRRHTGERPFLCSICADCFIDNQSMKKHVRTKHPEAVEDGDTGV